MDLAAVFTGIGAILTAAGGTILVVREFRRRDRIATNREIEEYSAELHDCRAKHIRWRHYAFELRQDLADAGLTIRTPPEDTDAGSGDHPLRPVWRADHGDRR